MRKKERRSFRRVTRIAARQAVKDGTITRLERGQVLLNLRSNDKTDEMADACLAQAVRCGIISPAAANAGGVDWQGIFQDVDWEKLAGFIKSMIAIFAAF